MSSIRSAASRRRVEPLTPDGGRPHPRRGRSRRAGAAAGRRAARAGRRRAAAALFVVLGGGAPDRERPALAAAGPREAGAPRLLLRAAGAVTRADEWSAGPRRDDVRRATAASSS